MRWARFDVRRLTAGLLGAACLLLFLAMPAWGASSPWIRAWGKDVVSGNAGTDFEICTTASLCKAADLRPDGPIGGELYRPADVAVAPNGDVYVADGYPFRAILVYDSSGQFKSVFPASSTVGGPQSLAIDGAGNVYLTEQGAARVQEFDSAGNFLRMWGKNVDSANPGTGAEICTVQANCQSAEQGTRGGEFGADPIVAVSQAGAVYVVERAFRERVQQFDSSGHFVRAWGKDVVEGNAETGPEQCTDASQCKAGAGGTAGGEFTSTWGIATDAAGNVYTAESGADSGENARIQKFGPTGTFVYALGKNVDGSKPGTGFEVCTSAPDCLAGTAGTTAGAFSSLWDVAVDRDGNIYTSEGNNHRIQEFGPSGAFVSTWGKGVAGGAGAETCTTVDGCQAGAIGGKGGEISYDLFGIGANAANGCSLYTAEGADGGRVQAFGACDSGPATIDTAITSGPAGGTSDTTPTFTFTAQPSSGATFQCAIDKGTFADCSTPYTTAPLPDGPHTLRVRATSPENGTDISPATRDFTVDTVAPRTVITLVPQGADSRKISKTKFSGTVRATAAEHDPSPGVGNGVTRCVLDPPTPPATYDDIPVGECPSPTTASLGTHTFYAASLDQAFNIGPVVSVTFRVVPAPDTQILGGPMGTTWIRTVNFSFTSTIAGSTFLCRIDGGGFGPCQTPYTTYSLSDGTHTLRVAAVSPEGAEDPTPAVRTFTVAQTETHDTDCRVSPFPEPRGQSQLGCGWGPRCPGRVSCGAALPSCPVSAVCTISLKGHFETPDDRFMHPPDINHPRPHHDGAWDVQDWIGFDKNYDDCGLSSLEGNTTGCTASTSTKFLGENRPTTTYCAANAWILFEQFEPDPGDFGPAEQRLLTCGARIKITAASALEAAAAGTHFTLYAPQPGFVYVVSDIAPAGAHATAARHIRAFRPLRKRVKKAGPVHFKPALTKAANRILGRRHKLVISLHVRFKPQRGKTIKRTRRVTLTRPLSPRKAARARLRAYCRKHRKLRRSSACRRVL